MNKKFQSQLSIPLVKPLVTMLMAFTLSSLVACGGGSGNDPEVKEDPIAPPSNQPPVLDAGDDIKANENTELVLNASATDNDGTISSYQWQQLTGPTLVISNAQNMDAMITLPATTEQLSLSFELTVMDDDGAKATDSIEVTVLPVNDLPTVEVNPEQTAIAGSLVTLQAQAVDIDGDALTFQWQQLTGTEVQLGNENDASTTFVAPSVEQQSELSFQVSVFDPSNQGVSAEIIVTVINMPKAIITGKLNDTGITDCSNDVMANLDCPIANFPGQDGEHGRDASANGDSDDSNGRAGFDFSKIDENGTELSVTASEWSCVRDNVTGFIWEVKSIDGGLQDNQHTYSWFENNNGSDNGEPNLGVCTGSDCDTASYVQAINQQGLCGANDWQVPTIRQLHSLIDYSRNGSGVAIAYEYFPNTLADDYWSSTLFATPLWAWHLNFYDATMKQTTHQATHNLRLIRANKD